MSDSEFKIINSSNVDSYSTTNDNTLDNYNATKNCESSDDEITTQSNFIIYVDDIAHCHTDSLDNIDTKMFKIASNLKNSISLYDNEINIYKKDNDIIITIRYKFFIISYESIYHVISYSSIDNYENLYD